MIGELGLIMLVVGDLRRSVQFYGDRLGLVVRDVTPTWAELDAGNIRLALHQAGEDVGVTPTTGCTFAFFVEDLRTTVDRLKAYGIEILREPRREVFGLLAAISDPDGYRIQLLEFSNGNRDLGP